MFAEIATAAARQAGGLSPALLGDFLATMTAAVAAGSRIRRRDLDRFAEQGRRAAEGGVAMRALIDLYLSAAWRLWPHLPDVAEPARDVAAVVRAGQVMLRATSDVAARLAEGYQLARRELVRQQTAARREFIDDLLLGGAHSTPELIDRAGQFGLDLAGPHAVAVIEADKPFTETSPLTGVLERSLLGSMADADALVATKQDRLVVVFAAPDRAAIDFVVHQLAALLPDQDGHAPVRLHRTAAVGAWRMGVGRPQNGPAGIRLSYEDATEALDMGIRFGSSHRIHDAGELLVQRVLIRDESAMRDLVTATLGPLAAARGGADALLTTLRAYFDAGGNATGAARALHLSVRALTYRLDRIATLTELDPTDPADRFTLQTAVTGARLLGWGETGRPSAGAGLNRAGTAR